MNDRELDTAIEDVLFAADKMYGASVPAPPYSTTGDGMLKVLEAMRERGPETGFTPKNPYTVAHGWWCKIQMADRASIIRFADSLPRAVALAALAALGQEAKT